MAEQDRIESTAEDFERAGLSVESGIPPFRGPGGATLVRLVETVRRLSSTASH